MDLRKTTHSLAAVLAALLLTSRLEAQGIIAGVAKDKHTGTALSCIDVAMTNARGDTVARTRTFDGGMFQFAAPPDGIYRLHFWAWGVYPVSSAPDSLGPTSEREVEHRLRLLLSADSSNRNHDYADSAALAPPQRVPRNASPEYPAARRRSGDQGTVVVRYLVDALGVLQPSSIETLASSDRSFARSVETFLREAKFTPGRRNHEPVCDLVTQQFMFRMRGQM
jgi:TonB family protein